MIFKGVRSTFVITPSYENGEHCLHVEMSCKGTTISATISQAGAASIHNEIEAWLKGLGWTDTRDEKPVGYIPPRPMESIKK